jgi:hypothetical protein
LFFLTKTRQRRLALFCFLWITSVGNKVNWGAQWHQDVGISAAGRKAVYFGNLGEMDINMLNLFSGLFTFLMLSVRVLMMRLGK